MSLKLPFSTFFLLDITKYLGIELGAPSMWKEKRRVGVVNGSHNQEDLQEKVYEFIQLLILCPKCGVPELKHIVKGNLVLKSDLLSLFAKNKG